MTSIDTRRNERGGASKTNLAAATVTLVYTVPDGNRSRVKIRITRRSTQTTFRMYLVPNGETQSDNHAIAWDIPITVVGAELELWLGSGDKVYVRAAATTDVNVSVQPFESEI